MVIYSYPPNFRFVSVKLDDGYDQSILKSLEKAWESLYPGYPMEYFFLDDEIRQLYSDEVQLSLAYNIIFGCCNNYREHWFNWINNVFAD